MPAAAKWLICNIVKLTLTIQSGDCRVDSAYLTWLCDGVAQGRRGMARNRMESSGTMASAASRASTIQISPRMTTRRPSRRPGTTGSRAAAGPTSLR